MDDWIELTNVTVLHVLFLIFQMIEADCHFIFIKENKIIYFSFSGTVIAITHCNEAYDWLNK